MVSRAVWYPFKNLGWTELDSLSTIGIMTVVNTSEARTQLSRLLRRVASGEEITIANRGVPVARLVAVIGSERNRRLGILRAELKVPEDFEAPLPDGILDLFEGRGRARKKS